MYSNPIRTHGKACVSCVKRWQIWLIAGAKTDRMTRFVMGKLE